MTGCGTDKATEACEGIQVYPAHTTETAAALIADPESAERFKAAVARYGSRTERAAVRHVTGLSSPGEGVEHDQVSLYVETDRTPPPPIDGLSDERYSEKSRAHDRLEQEGKVIVRALSKWWRGRDASQAEHLEPWVWVQYEGGGGSMARETFEASRDFCAPR
ncbi:hypothetical protein [Streptomyces sp. P17]|uniref:hypothetical protein n=1 Tax=Streptomyces sp. P17 TaxID=3074716 RepID=UPI0028F4531E|nr:hypothetical protein [Streptomyces sp. P17]MDT9695268.1 hypothetical protein [Streptomyces sp. P17]